MKNKETNSAQESTGDLQTLWHAGELRERNSCEIKEHRKLVCKEFAYRRMVGGC